ncbi:MAG: hypothetical protein KF690_09885 [Bacteroidetes bacterium]|nr:hypothetical protein [Bacteroidota bacterium]
MRIEVLMDDHRLRLQLNRDVPSLEWYFKPGYVFLAEEFRQAHRQLVSYFETYVRLLPRLTVLYDTSPASLLSAEEAKYAAAHITPLMVAAGLRREAFVVPEDVFMQMLIEDYKTHTQDTLEVGIFRDVGDARQWLAAL